MLSSLFNLILRDNTETHIIEKFIVSILLISTEQLKTESGLGEILDLSSPEGDLVPGLQSHIESPGAQGVVPSHVPVVSVVFRLRYLLPIDEEPGVVNLPNVLPRLDTVGD